MSLIPKMVISESILAVDLDDPLFLVLKELSRHPDKQFVVVRRKKGNQIYWYVFAASYFIQHFGPVSRLAKWRIKAGRRRTLRGTLGGLIHEHLSSETITLPTEEIPFKTEYEHIVWPGAKLPVQVSEGRVMGVYTREAAKMGEGSGGDVWDITKGEEDTIGRYTADVLTGGSAGAAAATPVPELPKEVEILIPEEPTGGRQKGDSATPVFPSITPSSEHVVQGKSFDVRVRLVLEKDEKTSGSATLLAAPVETVFKLDVHLLFGDQSHWGELEFSRARGSTKPAEFCVMAPVLVPDEHNVLPDRIVESIRVNYYLNHRWCGEGIRNVEILGDSTVSVAGVPTPEEPEWRKWLNVEPDAIPPDLLIRIQKTGNYQQYLWSFLSPHMNFRHYQRDESLCTLEGGPADFVRNRFESVVNSTFDDMVKMLIEGTCEDIYRTAPEAFKDAYWKLYREAANPDARTSFKTIQFVTDEPFVPWEIMRMNDPVRAPDVDAEVLSVRHSVGRWLATQSCQLHQRIPVHEMAVFATDYAGVNINPKLPWANQERAHFLGIGANRKITAQPKQVRKQDVLAFLTNGTAQAVHFVCHGKMNPKTPDLSVILLEDDQQNFKPPVVANQAVQRGLGTQHPLVFLNSCQIGQVGQELGLMSGWPSAFLNIGSSAFIAPLWSVADAHAGQVSQEFYDRVFADPPATLGDALSEIRAQWVAKSNLTYLAYVLYGDPNARIEVKP